MVDLLIRGVDVIHTAPGVVGVDKNHDIAITGNRIETIRPNGQIDVGRAREVIEAAGMIAMPGLVNAHCHNAMVLFRGAGEDVRIDKWFNDVIWPLESNLTAEDVYWGAQLGLAEMIEAGVTTAADHYFFMDEVANAVEQAGTRAHLSWAMFSLGVDEPLKKLEEAAHFIRKWQGAANGRITTWLGPHAPYTCDDGFLWATLAEAK